MKKNDIKILHTEDTMKDMLRQSGGSIQGQAYLLPDGVVRYFGVRQTRCGIDGIMNHFAFSRRPITERDMDVVMHDWNNGR